MTEFKNLGVYSDMEIHDAVLKGHIVCYPLNGNHIRGSSIDVTLGRYFYLTDKIGNQHAYNPYDPDDVLRYFGHKWLEATSHRDWSSKHKYMKFYGIEEDEEIIVLAPGERILAHTHEFIGIKPPGTSEMRARSTTGRNGIVACKDAGWGDPGFINRWTMEIQNDNSEAVPLVVGSRIAQIIFHHTGPVQRSYGSDGKYQSGDELEDIIANWSPEQMLPRAYDDARPDPAKVKAGGGRYG